MTGAQRPPAGSSFAAYETERRNGETPVTVQRPADDRFSVAGVTPLRRRTSWTAAELMAEVFPPTRWAVPDIIAEGVTLLAGSPKLGKSWLMLAVSIAVASGGKALGRVDVDAGDVLYCALEDTGRRLQDRTGRILAGGPAPRRLRLELAVPRFSAGGRDFLVDWLEHHPAARLVVVDVLARMRDPVAPGQQYEADYAAVAGFKELADHYGVAVVLVHHVRKQAADDFLDAVSGTNGLAGAADSVLVMQRARARADGLLRLTGRDVEEQEHALRWTPALGLWELLEGPAVDYTVGETRAAILAHLRTHGPTRPKDLAAAVGEKPVTVRVTLSRMVEDGQLERDGAGLYRVAGEELDDHVKVEYDAQLLDPDQYDAPDHGRWRR